MRCVTFMPEPSASPIAPEARRRRHGWRRWLFRAAIALVGLFLLIFVVGEIIFATNLPRNLVVPAVEKTLGLKLTVKSLSTGWLGNTSLGDVTLTLPLSDKAFATVPSLKIKHSSIPWLLITGDVKVYRIELDDPTLRVVQRANGSWNLLEALQLVTRAGGSKNVEDQQKSGLSIPALPALKVNNATLVVDDNKNRSVTIEHVGVQGNPNGPLVYEYDAAVPDHLEATGKVAPGGTWTHAVTLHAHDVSDWASPWIKDFAGNTAVDLDWKGQVNSGVVAGRLEIKKAVYADNSVAGPVEITAQEGGGTLRPVGLRVEHGAKLSAILDSGRLVVSGSNLQIQRVGIAFAGGRANLDGNVGLSNFASTLSLAWRDVAIPPSADQSGTLSIEYAPALGRPHLSATLKNNGSIKDVTWDAQIDAKASGPSLDALSLELIAPRLRIELQTGQTLDLSGLSADIEPSPDGYQMTSLQLAGAGGGGQGGYIREKKAVWLSLDGNDWELGTQKKLKLDIDLLAWAAPNRVYIDHLYLKSGLVSAYFEGEYVADRPKPIRAHLDVYEVQPPKAVVNSVPFRGRIDGSVQFDGTVSPVNLTMEGIATATDVHVGPRPLGDMKLNLLGGVVDDEVWVSSRDVEMLGGSWQFRGHWPVPNELLKLDQLSVRHLSLAQAAASDLVQGSLDGNWVIDVNSGELDDVTIRGSATVTDLAIGGTPATTQPVATEASVATAPSTQPAGDAIVAVDRIEMPNVRLQSGEARIAPITLYRTLGGLSGKATAEASANVAHPEQVQLKIDAKSWPIWVDPDGATVSGSARAHLMVDLLRESAEGYLDLNGEALWKGKDAGEVKANLEMLGREVMLNQLSGKVLSGTVGGEGDFDLDHPMQATAQFGWGGLDLGTLREYDRMGEQITGKLSGSLELRPATVPRPLEPLYLAMHFIPDNVKISRLALGKGNVYLYIGDHRLVSAVDQVSGFEMAGGELDFWGRVSRHEKSLYQSLVQMTLKDINLDSLMPPTKKKSEKVPGILNGQITMLGRPGTPEATTAQGSLTLTESDLASTGAIGFVYSLMHIGHDSSKPTGRGTIELAVQNESLLIPSMHYFDKGAEVRIAGHIDHLLKLPDSPLTLFAVGSARPLAQIDLPAFGDIDRVLGAIQQDAVSVKVTGTIADPKWRTVPFGELGREVKNFLLLDAFSSHPGEGD
jgi:hypothetical protein